MLGMLGQALGRQKHGSSLKLHFPGTMMGLNLLLEGPDNLPLELL